MQNLKIIICGGYGNHNLGDDAQLLNNCRLFKEYNFDKIKIISHRDYIANLCNFPTIGSFRNDFKNYKDNNYLLGRCTEIINGQNISEEAQKIIDEIKNCDILFMSGSGTLNTRNYYGMLLALIPMGIAIRYKKRIILSGQGFAPMDNSELENLLKVYLNQCELISIRDFENGYKILKRIGVNDNLIHMGIDDAFTLPEEKMNLEILDNAVAINISYYLTPNLYQIFSNLADELKLKGYNPVFCYFYPKDKESIEKCTTKYPIIGFNNPMQAKWFFSKCIATIGMRYHSAILSLGTKTPVINIHVNEYQKLKFDAINYKEIIVPCLDGQKVTIKKIMDSFTCLDSNKIVNLYNEWKDKGNYAIKYLAESKKESSLLQLIKNRRSIRKFKDIPISEKDLLELVEVGIFAPSGSNTQCYRFKIIVDRKDIEFLADKKIKCVANASAIILVIADLSNCTYLNGKRAEIFNKLPYQDCAMSMQNICLLAEEKGIGQCIIHLSKEWPTNDEIKNYFQLKDYHELQGMILLGYPDEIVDYENAKHAGKLIKRKKVEDYLL